MLDSKVKVAVRIRPFLSKEAGQAGILATQDNSITSSKQRYNFDNVFDTEVSQEQLYEKTAAPLLESFLNGINCTIMAYGQTGSGKTHTMGTSIADEDSENQGLISRLVSDVFERLNASIADSDGGNYQIKVTYLEIYKEDVFDLLSNETFTRKALSVREDSQGKVCVQDLQECIVQNAASALEVLNLGVRNRASASTQANAVSSRSHAVFTISLEQHLRDNNATAGHGTAMKVLRSKFTFVDLAGSERMSQTGAEAQVLAEAIDINKGLSTLGRVINSIASKASHIPYRDSKLTHLLKDALGGNSKTLFLACVSPTDANKDATLSTLKYAREAAKVQNTPVQNLCKVKQTQAHPSVEDLESRLLTSKAALQIANQRAQEMEKELQIARATVDKLQCDLQTREAQSSGQAALYAQELQHMQAQEVKNKHKESALQTKEWELMGREVTLQTVEATLTDREKTLLTQEETYRDRERSLQMRENQLRQEQMQDERAAQIRQITEALLQDKEALIQSLQAEVQELTQRLPNKSYSNDYEATVWDDGAAYEGEEESVGDNIHGEQSGQSSSSHSIRQNNSTSRSSTPLRRIARKIVTYADSSSDEDSDVTCTARMQTDSDRSSRKRQRSAVFDNDVDVSDTDKSGCFGDGTEGEGSSSNTSNSSSSSSDGEESDKSDEGEYVQARKRRRSEKSTMVNKSATCPRMRWRERTDARLTEGVQLHGLVWAKVAEHVGGGVNGQQCRNRWSKHFKPLQQGLKKGGDWTDDELAALPSLVKKYIIKSYLSERYTKMTQERVNWTSIGQELGRVPKDCSDKWKLSLASKMKKDPFTAEEDALVLQRVAEWGDKGMGLWISLAKEMGRRDCNINRRWKTLSKK